jgi:hypothetical protein
MEDKEGGGAMATVLSHATNIMDPVTAVGAMTLGASGENSLIF